MKWAVDDLHPEAPPIVAAWLAHRHNALVVG